MNKRNKGIKVHFIGVGGAGVSVLARLLLSKNFTVSGSDIAFTKTVEDLTTMGLKFNLGHDASAVENVDVVVYSSAISLDNVELLKAKQLKKATFTRAEFLSLILTCYKKTVGISGSHGKTTATSMLANMLKYANKQITALIGGSDINLGSFVFSPSNYALITEVCEFAKNIKEVTTSVAVCLNIDNDHLDSYGSFGELKKEFYSYLSRAKFKVLCADDKELSNYKGKNVITYGAQKKADYFATNVKSNGGKYSFDLYYKDKYINRFDLSVYGIHNVYNALSCIAVANSYFKLSFEDIYKGLLTFKGVMRRFEEYNLFDKKIIFDYAHHPTEIEKSILAVKEFVDGDFLTVFQPHTYSRTKLLFNDFVKVLSGNNIIIYKEYPAREVYDELGSSKRLSENVKNSIYFDDINLLLEYIKDSKYANVLVLGAGDLYDKIKNAD